MSDKENGLIARLFLCSAATREYGPPANPDRSPRTSANVGYQ